MADDDNKRKVVIKNEEEPAIKKAKVEEEEDGDSGNDNKAQTNEEGDTFYDLSTKRRVTVRKFKSSILIDIREFYEDKKGDMKPGKKGISLNKDQYETLKDLMKDGSLDAAVQKLDE